MNLVGWPSGAIPVAHKSEIASSCNYIPGSAGAEAPVTMPRRRFERD